MILVDESLAKGLSKKIIGEVFDSLIPSGYNFEAEKLNQMPHKKQIRELIKLCKKNNKLVYLDDRHRETSKWELIWGEWNLGYKGTGSSATDKRSYDRLFFDLTYNGRSFAHYKFFYVALSKHALIRMIMRSGTKITTANQAYAFITALTKDVVTGCLSMLESNKGKLLFTNGFYLPVAMEEGKNINGGRSVCFTIKTIMPKHFKVNSRDLVDRSKFKTSLFEYSDHFPANKN